MRFYVVARWDLNYNGVDYVMYKVFEQRLGDERKKHYMGATTIIGKDRDRWSIKWLSAGIFPIASLSTNLRIVVLEDMLSGRFYSPTFEIQDLYSKLIADGVFNMHLFDRGLRELYDQEFDLSEILSTYVYEEYKRYSELDYYKTREDYVRQANEDLKVVAEEAQAIIEVELNRIRESR